MDNAKYDFYKLTRSSEKSCPTEQISLVFFTDIPDVSVVKVSSSSGATCIIG